MRKPIERAVPRAHLVVDDFFSAPALRTIFAEIASLDPHLKPGLVREVGHDGQSVFFENPRRRNQAVWLHDPSKTLRLFREHLWSASMLPVFEGAREPLFQIIPRCGAPNLQVSRYMTGDHYDFHEDEGAGVNLTAVVFLAAKPEKVRGGHLVLAYDGAATTIRFRHNRLVIFPSKTLHRVTRVRVDSKDPRHARISLQSWLAYGAAEQGTARAKTPRSPKPRAPEADQPTFLLSEEPIIGAAQSLLSPAAHAPEELYWGAFYLTRILTQNLRWLAAEVGIGLGPVRVRRVGATLEVFARARPGMTVGFVLRGPEIVPAEAVDLFVERGKKRAIRAVPVGDAGPGTVALLGQLLG